MNQRPSELHAEEGFRVPPMPEQERMVEAIVFAAREPVASREIAERLPAGCDVGEALSRLRERYGERGVRLTKVDDAWAFRTAPDLGFLMVRETVETRKLGRAAVETLAIIAYHQPVTRAEIEEIRGVSVSGGTLDALIELGWVRLGKRRQTPGRPMTFAVTPAFLDHFGLESQRDLPGIAELRAAGLLDNRPDPGGLGGLPGLDRDPDPDADPADEASDADRETVSLLD